MFSILADSLVPVGTYPIVINSVHNNLSPGAHTLAFRVRDVLGHVADTVVNYELSEGRMLSNSELTMLMTVKLALSNQVWAKKKMIFEWRCRISLLIQCSASWLSACQIQNVKCLTKCVQMKSVCFYIDTTSV